MLLPCIFIPAGFALLNICLGGFNETKSPKAYKVLLAAFIVLLFLVIFNKLHIILYWLNLVFYDTDTIITEYLIARRNESIFRYIKALLLLHHKISGNSILREVFAKETEVFTAACRGAGGDDEDVKNFSKLVAESIDYFRAYYEGNSLMDVLFNEFDDDDYSHISLMTILKPTRFALVFLAFNAAKIRANMKIFKNEVLRTAVISALK